MPDIITSIISGLKILIQFITKKNENNKALQNEKKLNIKNSLECIDNISLVPEILRIIYKVHPNDISLNEKYTKAVRSVKVLDNLLSNYFKIKIFYKDLLVLNNLSKYLTTLYKPLSGCAHQKTIEDINNAFKFSQIEMNRLVINFLEQPKNAFDTDLRESNSYQIEVVRVLVHYYIVKIFQSNDKSNFESFLQHFKTFVDLISKEVEQYFSLYEKNDHNAIEKIIKEKNSCIALYFIHYSFEDTLRKVNSYELKDIISRHRSLYNYCLNLSDEETLFDYHCKEILSSKDNFLQISNDAMTMYSFGDEISL